MFTTPMLPMLTTFNVTFACAGARVCSYSGSSQHRQHRLFSSKPLAEQELAHCRCLSQHRRNIGVTSACYTAVFGQWMMRNSRAPCRHLRFANRFGLRVL